MANPLNIAIVGTRGVPANYGGFETFAQELSVRLVARGHKTTVYGRAHYVPKELESYCGVKIRRLPAFRTKYLETVSHTAISTLDLVFRPFDIVLFCNAANTFLTWIPRLRGMGSVINVDGIERFRAKWSRLGKEFYRLNERFASWFPNRVVTDARTIQDYYRAQYGMETCFIPYGAPAEKLESREILGKLGVNPMEYLLYVSRLEPENNAHRVIEGYLASGVQQPLVLVGDAPYGHRYIERLRRLSEGKSVLMPGAIYGKPYRELLSHCICYLHGCEVGGTHPALVEAMGAGALVISNDTAENREVLGETGLLCSFHDVDLLSIVIAEAVSGSCEIRSFGKKAQERVRSCYSWEQVTDRYEELFYELAGQRDCR